MIDYLIIIYKNYDLLELQIKNFQKLFNKEEYKLIVVDNTPNAEKLPIVHNKIIDKIILLDSVPTFDGISHGNAIDQGLKYCESDIVSVMDSDYFILNPNIHSYVYNKFQEGYLAVGTEYNDGKDTNYWVNLSPEKFENIPCCFGSYYKKELATAESWIITPEDVDRNRSTGFVEVGFKIRKYILDNKIKTFNWKTSSTSYGNCYFNNEFNEVMGFHYVAGSHRRWDNNSKSELENLIGI